MNRMKMMMHVVVLALCPFLINAEAELPRDDMGLKMSRKETKPELDGAQEGVAARIRRAESLSFQADTPLTLFGVEFGSSLSKNPVGKTGYSTMSYRSVDLGKLPNGWGRFSGLSMLVERRSCEESSLSSKTITLYGSVKTRKVFRLMTIVSDMARAKKALSTVYGCEPVMDVIRSEPTPTAAWRYDLGDVSIFLMVPEKGSSCLIAMNWALTELALKESEARSKADTIKAENDDLSVLIGGKKGLVGHGSATGVVIPGFRGHRFGEKKPKNAQVIGGSANTGMANWTKEPVVYKKFTTMELGYARKDDSLGCIRLIAYYGKDISKQRVHSDLLAVKADLEKQLSLNLEGDGDSWSYEDDRYTVKLDAGLESKVEKKTVFAAGSLSAKRFVTREVEVMAVKLELVDKRYLAVSQTSIR